MPPGLVARAQAIILRPRTEWAVIAGEATTVGQLYRGYAMWLAAIPAVATFIGEVVFGVSAGPLGTVRTPIGTALVEAILGYLIGLCGTYLVGWIVNALAPTFGGTQDAVQAQKLTVYGATPGWLAGIFAIIPGLGFLEVLGIYAIYLYWLGLPILMKSPPDRTLLYFIAILVAAIVIFGVIAAIFGALFGAVLFAF